MSNEANERFIENCKELHYFDWKVDNMSRIMSKTSLLEIGGMFIDDMYETEGRWLPKKYRYYWERG